jgi:transposase InsO family protein
LPTRGASSTYHGGEHEARSAEDEAVAADVARAYGANRGTYGGPRVHAALRAEARRLSRKRVIRLMRAQRLAARRRRRFRRTTHSKHRFVVAENVLARRFEVAASNVAWVTI